MVQASEKVYLRATALLFKSLDDGGLQLGFIVDGRLSQEHELAFAASAGFQRFIDKAYAGKDLDAERRGIGDAQQSLG